jgi:hypothetical protein
MCECENGEKKKFFIVIFCSNIGVRTMSLLFSIVHLRCSLHRWVFSFHGQSTTDDDEIIKMVAFSVLGVASFFSLFFPQCSTKWAVGRCVLNSPWFLALHNCGEKRRRRRDDTILLYN